MSEARTDPSITRDEHDDALSAKRILPITWNSSGGGTKQPTPFVDLAFDYVGFSNADGNGNYQTIAFNTGGAGGTTVRTLALTYDGNNNVTTITRS